MVHGITSLPRERTVAKDLLAATRGYWGSRTACMRRGTGHSERTLAASGRGISAVMAVVRNIVIFLFNREGYMNAAAAARRYVCQPDDSMALASTPA